MLINKCNSVNSKHCNNSKAFIKYLNGMDDKTKHKTSKTLILFDDILSNEKLQPIVTEFFVTGRKLNISLVFIKQSYFAVPKSIRMNSTHSFIMEIPNRRELQQFAINHSSGIDFKNVMNLKYERIEKLIMKIDDKIRDKNYNMILTEN